GRALLPARPIRRPAGDRESRASPAGRAEAAKLDQVLLDAEAGGPAHLGERPFQRPGVELARASAAVADERVVAARLPPGARPYRGGAQHAMEQAQLEQRGDVAVHRDAIDRDPSLAQL